MTDAKSAALELLVTCTSCRIAKPRAAFFADKREQRPLVRKGMTERLRRSRCKECERKRYDDRKRRDPALYLFFRVKYRAKQEGIEFNLEPSDVFIPTHCPVLGIELAPVWSPQGTDAKPTLDRLDATRGYVRGNVKVISSKANRMKGDASVAELERIAAWMRSEGL